VIVERVIFTARTADVADAEAIGCIYNESVPDHLATFEGEPRTAEQIAD
jgi:L-amino acid N-acyltransferase YncA